MIHTYRQRHNPYNPLQVGLHNENSINQAKGASIRYGIEYRNPSRGKQKKKIDMRGSRTFV